MPEYRLTRLRGEWAVAIYEGKKRVHRHTLGTTDEAEAERKLDAFKRGQQREQQPTIKAIWDSYRREKEGRQVAENMEWSGRAILPMFGSLLPDQITLDTCKEYIAKRRSEGRKDGTIWTEMNHLQIALNWAFKKAKMIPHPVSLERPSKPPPRNERLTKREGRRLAEAADTPHIKLAIELMIGTTARSGAVLDLTWDRVDFQHGRIKLAVEGEEGRKGRATVPMTRRLRRALEEARKAALTNYVIEWGGKQVGSIKTGFARAVTRAGLEGVTPHVLRHSAATWMAEDGVSMEEIAQYLGHRDVATTRRIYARFTPDHLRRAAESLELDDEDD